MNTTSIIVKYKGETNFPACGKHEIYLNENLALQYGFSIQTMYKSEGYAGSIACKFCINFGREDAAINTGKRKRATVYTQNGPIFVKENLRRHVRTQHPKKMEEYKEFKAKQGLGRLEEFFIGQNMHAPDGSPISVGRQRVMDSPDSVATEFGEQRFHIDDRIVGIVEDMYVFKKYDTSTLTDDDVRNSDRIIEKLFDRDDETGESILRISHYPLFIAIVSKIACGMTYSHISKDLESSFDSDETWIKKSVNTTQITTIARQIVPHSLEMIRHLLTKTWGFSISSDGGSNSGSKYFGVRLRIFLDKKIHDLHLGCLPRNFSQKGVNLAELLNDFLTAICPDWKDKLLAVGSDGETKMSGKWNGCYAVLEREIRGRKLLRTWCAIHQLDLHIKEALSLLNIPSITRTRSDIKDKRSCFIIELNKVIAYLRNHDEAVRELGGTCPIYVSTRWLSLYRCMRWITEKFRRVKTLLQNAKKDVCPADWFWVTFFCVERLVTCCADTVVKLQTHSITVVEQQALLLSLQDQLKKFVTFTTNAETDEVSQADGCTAHTMKQCVPFGLEKIHPQNEETQIIMRTLPSIYIIAINGMKAVVNSSEKYAQDDPIPDTSIEAIQRMSFENFQELLEFFKIPLSHAKYSKETLEDEWLYLTRYVKTDEIPEGTFTERWHNFHHYKKLKNLAHFCCVIGSITANNASVESGFSIVKFEKSIFRKLLSDLSLEGALHSKQYRKLVELYEQYS